MTSWGKGKQEKQNFPITTAERETDC
uniref:Uncharacterized protein n=1 Tax=Rhizophora mucronata TaxID=61149 RepID=A0A2P2QSZ9_RHIMU